MDNQALLSVNNISKSYSIRRNFLNKEKFKVLNSISFNIKKGETVGLIGESGCGKSTLGKIITKMLTSDNGNISFENEDITNMLPSDFSKVRHKIQMIFQDPNGALNPSYKIGWIMNECLKTKGMKNKSERNDFILKMLPKVGLSFDYLDRFPHELSGGQKQRISILLALFLEPKLIVADEVVSALDVSVRSQILNLLKELQHSMGLSYLFISHDLNVVYYMSDRILVMYLGEIVEEGNAEDIYRNTSHPYTQMLFQSLLDYNDNSTEKYEKSKIEIIGEVPKINSHHIGCKFANRCHYSKEICLVKKPSIVQFENEHKVSCHYADYFYNLKNDLVRSVV